MDDIETLLTKLLMSDVIKCRGLTVGLARYIEIQEMLQKTTNIADATHFQKLFRKFYGMRFANAEWQQTFFQFMQERRYTPPSFNEIMALMAERFGRCEPSFSSKLAATLKPDLPVLDSRVLSVMATHLPERGNWKLLRSGPLDKKMKRASGVYYSLCAVIAIVKMSPNFARLSEKFDAHHGAHGLTETKKLDLILWQYRQ
jgi:hypothetical protein